MNNGTPPYFGIREFGAKGDGRTNDAKAIQAAIDACGKAGGGTVLCPPGVYFIGSIQLRSNVQLHLVAGATLLGSAQRGDFSVFDRGVSDQVRDINYAPEHLIYAENETNVAITGMGEIDGNGRAYFGPVTAATNNKYSIKNKWRPIQLVAFVNCRNVTLEGVTFRDAPGWTIWPLGCDGVRITGIKIHNDPRGPNSDGIDIDTCRNVIISDCLIEAGDDCISCKSDKSKKPVLTACEYVTVTNCILKTTCCALRIGYEGDHPVRHCRFGNLVIKGTRVGISILAPRKPGFCIEHGPAIEDISFSDMIMDTDIPFFLWTGADVVSPAGIRGIRFHNITATTERGCHCGGSEASPLEDISFSNIDISVRGPMDSEFAKEVPYPYSEWDYNTKRGIPHVFYFRHAKGIRLNNIRVEWKKAAGAWLSALRTECVEDMSINGFSETGKPRQA